MLAGAGDGLVAAAAVPLVVRVLLLLLLLLLGLAGLFGHLGEGLAVDLADLAVQGRQERLEGLRVDQGRRRVPVHLLVGRVQRRAVAAALAAAGRAVLVVADGAVREVVKEGYAAADAAEKAPDGGAEDHVQSDLVLLVEVAS